MTAKGRLQVLGSALQRVTPLPSRGKCASSVAFDAHSTSATTAHHRNVWRKEVNADKQSSPASGGTPPLNDISRRRRVLEARGVSVVYQRSATAEYRRRGDPALGITRSAVTSKQGGSVVALLSATERHRQQRRAERGDESRESTRTNPSSLKLPVTDEIMEYERTKFVQTKEIPAANVSSSAIMMVAGASSILLFALTIVSV